MKKVLLKICMVLALASCTEEVVGPDQTAQSEDVNQDPNARTPEGSGSGSGGGSTPGSIGFALSYQGNGIWVGGLGASPVWFNGPTPAQLKNGIQSDWPVVCPPGSSNCVYPDGFVVYGSGSTGFTVLQPMCSGTSTATITMERIKIVRDPRFVNPGNSPQTYVWETVTRKVMTLSSNGTCKLQYNGKVIVNGNCNPIIVDIDSDLVNLCGSGNVALYD